MKPVTRQSNKLQELNVELEKTNEAPTVCEELIDISSPISEKTKK